MTGSVLTVALDKLLPPGLQVAKPSDALKTDQHQRPQTLHHHQDRNMTLTGNDPAHLSRDALSRPHGLQTGKLSTWRPRWKPGSRWGGRKPNDKR